MILVFNFGSYQFAMVSRALVKISQTWNCREGVIVTSPQEVAANESFGSFGE